jgi:hypothetical protein
LLPDRPQPEHAPRLQARIAVGREEETVGAAGTGAAGQREFHGVRESEPHAERIVRHVPVSYARLSIEDVALHIEAASRTA